MTAGFLRRLHAVAIRRQLQLVLATIPLSALLLGISAEPLIAEVIVEQARPTEPDLRASLRALLVIVLGAVVVGTAGASMLLRGSLRAVVHEVADATRAIARGDLGHRVSSRRRDELGALAGSIDVMAERLETSERSRRELLACISHELRTPLTVIQGQAFTLGRLEEDIDRAGRLELVQQEAGRLARLIDDLIDASSLRAGSVKLRPERIDVRDVARDTVARLAAAAQDRGVDLRVRADRRSCWADADPDRIGQVLVNLVANAIRHATPGTDVTVNTRHGRDGDVVVSVHDRGAAIDAEQASRIFEPFEQGGSAPGRLGLGLSIARGLALAHGGRLVLADATAAARGDVSFALTLPPAADDVAPAGIIVEEERRRGVLAVRPTLAIEVDW